MSMPSSRSASFENRVLEEIVLNGEARHYVRPVSTPPAKQVPRAPDNTPAAPPANDVAVSSPTDLTAVTNALGALQMQHGENDTLNNDPMLSPVTVAHSNSPSLDSDHEALGYIATDEEALSDSLSEFNRGDSIDVINVHTAENHDSGYVLNANLYPTLSSSLSASPARIRTAQRSQEVHVSMGSPRPRANTAPRFSSTSLYTEPCSLDIGKMGEEVEADVARALSRLEIVARSDSANTPHTNATQHYTRCLTNVLSSPERAVKLVIETRAHSGLESHEASVLNKSAGDVECVLMKFLDYIAKTYPKDQELDILNQHYKRPVK